MANDFKYVNHYF